MTRPPPKEDEAINAFLEAPFQIFISTKSFKKNEIKKMIERNLNPKKAPGFDVITSRITKELPDKALIVITQIFNHSYIKTYINFNFR